MVEQKIKLANKKGFQKTGWVNGYVKPAGKFWKRLFNKRVRKGATHKKSSWFEWC